MLQKETRCIKSWLLKTFEQDEDFQLFSFVEIYIFFHLLLPFGSSTKKKHLNQTEAVHDPFKFSHIKLHILLILGGTLLLITLTFIVKQSNLGQKVDFSLKGILLV